MAQVKIIILQLDLYHITESNYYVHILFYYCFYYFLNVLTACKIFRVYFRKIVLLNEIIKEHLHLETFSVDNIEPDNLIQRQDNCLYFDLLVILPVFSN